MGRLGKALKRVGGSEQAPFWWVGWVGEAGVFELLQWNGWIFCTTIYMCIYIYCIDIYYIHIMYIYISVDIFPCRLVMPFQDRMGLTFLAEFRLVNSHMVLMVQKSDYHQLIWRIKKKLVHPKITQKPKRKSIFQTFIFWGSSRSFFRVYSPENQHVPWKSMVGRCIPYWNGHFLGDILVFAGLSFFDRLFIFLQVVCRISGTNSTVVHICYLRIYYIHIYIYYIYIYILHIHIYITYIYVYSIHIYIYIFLHILTLRTYYYQYNYKHKKSYQIVRNPQLQCLCKWSTGSASRLDEAFHMYRTGADGCWESQYFFPDIFHIPVSIEQCSSTTNCWIMWGSMDCSKLVCTYIVYVYIDDLFMMYVCDIQIFIYSIYIYMQSCSRGIWYGPPCQLWNLRPFPRRDGICHCRDYEGWEFIPSTWRIIPWLVSGS